MKSREEQLTWAKQRALKPLRVIDGGVPDSRIGRGWRSLDGRGK
jgi:hypothetical protein